jgi:hypothetical protein
VLHAGRRFAERGMVDTWVIGVESRGELNEDTGEYENAFTQHYLGLGALTIGGTAPHEVDAAGQQLVTQSSVLALPVATSGGVGKDMVATCVASQNDPAMVGVKVRVAGPYRQTYATKRRFEVEEING